MWGGVETCGRLVIGPSVEQERCRKWKCYLGLRKVDCQSAAGFQPAPQQKADLQSAAGYQPALQFLLCSSAELRWRSSLVFLRWFGGLELIRISTGRCHSS